MLGAGGHAGGWIRDILPEFQDRLRVVGLVDVSEAALRRSGDYLGLDETCRFTEMRAAFEAVQADCCVIVVPAAFHVSAALLAAKHGLPILCEKPLADTWQACVNLYRAVKRSRVKMQVVQNYRYNAPMLAMRSVLES